MVRLPKPGASDEALVAVLSVAKSKSENASLKKIERLDQQRALAGSLFTVHDLRSTREHSTTVGLAGPWER